MSGVMRKTDFGICENKLSKFGSHGNQVHLLFAMVLLVDFLCADTALMLHFSSALECFWQPVWKIQCCYRYMSLVVRKPVLGVSDQVPYKPGCTITEYC